MKMKTIKTLCAITILSLFGVGLEPAGRVQTAVASPKAPTADVSVPISDKSCIRIGVLAKRGRKHCIDQWGPTAAYLTRQIPEYSFSILPLDFDHIFEAVANQEVDFIFANSSFYVELEVRFGVTRIATLNNLHSDGTAHAVFAGVIFSRADRIDINGLKDLKDKRVMAVDERSLGGWHMQWREMKARGIDPPQDFKMLTYGGTHDAVVYAVRDRTVDAGCVRSDTLERMELEGKIELSEFKIIIPHAPCDGSLRFLHSTWHYPEWPLAKAPHTGEALAKQVAVALMRMPASSPAAVAGKCAGWTIPQNYQPVHECLMELHLSPYQNYGKVTLGDFWRQYWPWLMGIAAMLIMIAAGAFYASRLQSRLRQSMLAQKERERAQAFLQTVIDGFPEALMVINDDYTIALANRTVLAMAGARDPVEDCLKCHQVSHECDQPCSGEPHPCPFDRIFKTKRPITLEHIHHDNTGEERIVELIAAPIFDEKGDVVKIIESCRDITDRKRAEKELSTYRDHLEELVQERTAQLEAANKELEAFAYSVSHDLRAPLRHIDGFLQMLAKQAGSALDEQGLHYIDIIADAAKKMGILIDDLLSFSRMGRQAMTVQQLNLDPLVSEVIREVEPDTVGRTIDWRRGDLPVVEGDTSMLRIVLANLITNAVKFTQPRERARIEIGALPDDGDEKVIFVRDNGVGFDMAYAYKLFGVFKRLHRADEFEGTGIGLANVRRIIARHGGRTWAEGKVDKGATFYFSLPSRGNPNIRTASSQL